MVINLPKLETKSVLDFINTINEIDFTDVNRVEINSEMSWVRPFGMIVAAVAIRSLRKKHLEVPFQFNKIPETDSNNYAGNMGFFKLISKEIRYGKHPGEAKGNENYLPISIINITELKQKMVKSGIIQEVGETIENESGRLAKIICREDEELRKMMTYLIREILRNIFEHSENKDALICGQYWSSGDAEIAIIDEGIGIKNSLQKNIVHQKYITDDFSALEYSLKPGISQSFHPAIGNRSDDIWSNSGYGLYMVSEICKELDGSFCITSGKNYLHIVDGIVHRGETHFEGTAIKISFSTKGLVDSKSIIERIALRGEKDAKQIRNSFKKASRPSRGLMNK